MIKISGWGFDIVGRMPTMDELDVVRKVEASPESFKDLARACTQSPPFADLMRAKPAAGPKLGMLYWKASGVAATITALTEDEIPDGALAEGYAEASKKGFGTLHALQVEHNGELLELVLREPREVEVDACMNKESVRTCKTMVDKITVWGAKGFESKAPGLYIALAHYMLEVAGLNEAAVVGEA